MTRAALMAVLIAVAAQISISPEPVPFTLQVLATVLTGLDRGLKLSRYARAGTPEVWILDLDGVSIESYTEPSDDLYRHVGLARPGQTLASDAVFGTNFRVDDVLGQETAVY